MTAPKLFIAKTVKAAADAANIGVGQTLLPGFGDINWLALGSTQTVPAKAHVGVQGAVYRLDGVRIANDEPDLFDGAIAANLDLTELLTPAPNPFPSIRPKRWDVVRSGISWPGLGPSGGIWSDWNGSIFWSAWRRLTGTRARRLRSWGSIVGLFTGS